MQVSTRGSTSGPGTIDEIRKSDTLANARLSAPCYNTVMSGLDQDAAGRTDRARSIWADVLNCLQTEKKRLYDEIRHYPTPITACDQQFNYLLEQQACISGELTRLHKAIAETDSPEDPLAAVGEFVESSECIDAETRERLRSRLTERLSS